MAAVFIIHLWLVLGMSLEGPQGTRAGGSLSGEEQLLLTRVTEGHAWTTRQGHRGKPRTADKDMIQCTHNRSFCRSSAHQNIHASTLLFESPSPSPKFPFSPSDGYNLFGTLLTENAIFVSYFFFNICFLKL